MKRKNILKFVSLLGIGSFVMLAAASCTKTTTNTPTPNPNPPSDGGNTNPGGGETMNNVDPELAAARTALTTLINSQTQNIEKYADYAKIQDTLTKAYGVAKTVLNNSASTTQNLKDAQKELEAAISTADKAKTDFNTTNSDLVAAYNVLKEELKKEKSNLDTVTEDKYAAIRANFVSLYEKAKTIVTATLDPVMGNVSEVKKNVDEVNKAIMTATSRNDDWKKNADNLTNSFIKQVLDKKNVTGVADTNNKVQPGNYSFVGYRVDVSDVDWNLAQRKVFTLSDIPLETPTTEGESQQAAPLTDVSWIYSLSGDQAKYTLNFRYFGASTTAYLYFPYKLVKDDDKNNIGLQYKLNDATESTEITFGNQETNNNKTPTVDDIKIAKVTLSNLKFNSNKIEFSVPTSKVAPMIGNMYLTTSDSEVNKRSIENSIFGNTIKTENNKTIISVDPLSSYSLAADKSTVIYEYSNENLTLDGKGASGKKYYLIGWVGGNGQRGTNSIPNQQDANIKNSPITTNDNSRNYTFYVNAPKDGNYHIKGIYSSGSARGIKFATGTEESNHVTINNLNSMSTNEMPKLNTFDTSSTAAPESRSSHAAENKTLKLKAGLNKIIVSGVTGTDNGNAPNSGYFEFILDETQPAAAASVENASGQ